MHLLQRTQQCRGPKQLGPRRCRFRPWGMFQFVFNRWQVRGRIEWILRLPWQLWMWIHQESQEPSSYQHGKYKHSCQGLCWYLWRDHNCTCCIDSVTLQAEASSEREPNWRPSTRLSKLKRRGCIWDEFEVYMLLFNLTSTVKILGLRLNRVVCNRRKRSYYHLSLPLYNWAS